MLERTRDMEKRARADQRTITCVKIYIAGLRTRLHSCSLLRPTLSPMADNSIMDETFDFSELSLEEPGDRMAGLIEQSLQLNEPQSAIPSYSSDQQQQQSNLLKLEQQSGSTTNSTGETIVDNGPWATLPSSSRLVDPYQPGITAQKLDAMAADPNHIFKSNQTPSPFPFSVPPSPPSSTGAATRASTTTSTSFAPSVSSVSQAKTVNKDIHSDEKDLTNDKIPAWMLEDPELVPSWTLATASHDQAADEDWASLPDRSTTVDGSALFGFTSYPSYESLPIANAISEEQYRRQRNDDGHDSDLLPQTEPAGGFAHYGEQSPAGLLGQEDSLFAGAKQQFTGESTSSSLSHLQEWRTAGSAESRRQGQTTSRMEVDEDEDDFFVEEDEDDSRDIK